MSWSTGREEGWRGTSMFGLFAAGEGRGLEKRVLCFGAGGEEGCVEVRVHRAGGRRRRRVGRAGERFKELRVAGMTGGVR